MRFSPLLALRVSLPMRSFTRLLLLWLGAGLLASAPARSQSSGHGNWLVSVTYLGSVTTSASNTPCFKQEWTIQGQPLLLTPSTYDLSTYANSPDSTSTGTITGALSTSAATTPLSQPHDAQLNIIGGTMRFQFTWQPKNNNSTLDPPPATITVLYKRTAIATATAGSSTVASIDGKGASAPPNQTQADSGLTQKALITVSNGVATKDFTLSATLDAHTDPGAGNNYGSSAATVSIELCVPGFTLSRSDKRLNPLSGNRHHRASDPSFTRWLPLTFSPEVNSQPVRMQAGALPIPWGNLNCAYSIVLQSEPFPTPNQDINGYYLLYIPPNLVAALDSAPTYNITDANGDRLLFNSSLGSFNNVRSTLAQNGVNFELRNAGPPGALKNRGPYTYTFQVARTNPLLARLVSIQQDLLNGQPPLVQTLTWNNLLTPTGDPFLTVEDYSSGRSLRFHPGANGYLGSVDNGSNVYVRTVLTYDANGHAQTIKVYDPLGITLYHQDSYTYGGPTGDSVVAATQPTFIGTNPLDTASYVYASDASLTDPFGNVTPRLSSVTYGDSADTASSDDGLSVQGTVSYTYGPLREGYNSWGIDAHTNTTTDPRGSLFKTVFTMANDNDGPITSLTNIGPDFTGATPGFNVSRTVYSPNIDIPSVVTTYDPLYNAGLSPVPWATYLDGNRRPTNIVDPLSHGWAFAYTGDGLNLASTTDPTNITWRFNYGENQYPPSRLTSVTDPAGVTRVQITYNAFGQALTRTVPAAVSASGTSELTAFTYDSATGDLTRVTDPLSDIATINAYDALGDPLSVSVYPDTGNPATSLKPLTTGVVYDPSQQVTQMTLPSSVQINNVWNNGFLSAIQTSAPAAAGGATLAQMNFLYDTRGRLYSASDLVGTAASYRFDKSSNLTKVLDGRGNTTRFTYGPNNEPTGVTWPDNIHSASLRYDIAGRLTLTTDERGVTAGFLYDNAHRLTDTQFPATPAQNVQITYDPANRPLTITQSGTGYQQQFSYDPVFKRLQSVVTILPGLPFGHNTFTVSYTYYSDGTLATMTSPVGQTQYHYNAAGQLTSLTDPFSNTTTWNYDHARRVTSERTVASGGALFITSYAYGNSNQAGDPTTAPAYLKTITESINRTSFKTYTLTHSYLGQLLTQQGVNNPFLNQTGPSSETFTYDNRGRLMTESDTCSPPGSSQVLSNTGAYQYDLANNLQGGANGWAYNSDNQVTSAPAMGGLPGGTGFSYDAAGNLTGLNGSVLSYDCWGRLISASGATYTYDPAGRRISKTYGGVTTYYLYAGSTLLAELDSGGNLTRSYTWGALGLISDQSPSTGSRFYFFDGAGNTRNLLSSTGASLGWQSYTGWGARYAGTLPSNVAFGWKGRFGQYLDSETGLLYLGARYYAPAIGRFLSRDPIGFAGGINLYAYCFDNPIDFYDSDGAYAHIIVGAVLGAVAGGVTAYFSGDDVWHGALVGGVAGGVGAATFGLAAPALTGVLGCTGASAAAGALSGLTSDITAQGLEIALGDRTKLDPWQTLFSTGLGGLFGWIGSPFCFAEGTPVQVMAEPKQEVGSVSRNKRSASGNKPHTTSKRIEHVKAGDIVVSRNEQTGQTAFRRVVRTTIRKAPLVLSIHLADAKTGRAIETITATREHPFYVQGKGFVPAGGLAVGNAIITRAGPPLVVQSVAYHRRPEGYKVYNLVVEDDHTYFIGKANGGLWVHNPRWCPDQGVLPYDDLPEPVELPEDHHIATNKHRDWTPKFEPIFDQAGLDMNGTENRVSLPGHYGPHPNAYHQWVFDRLSQADGTHQGVTGALDDIRQWLLNNPTRLNFGPYP